jgi:hypothetical protein
VSLVDLETGAASVPGVSAVRASWRWDEGGLRPAAVLSYIGDVQLLPLIRTKLRSLAEPDAAIAVVRAQPQPASLTLQLIVDPEFLPADVIARATSALYAPTTVPGSGGILRAGRLGPDGVVFLSHIVEAVMAIEGVSGLESVGFNGLPFEGMGRKPPVGRYWDFGEMGSSTFGISIHGVTS